MFSLDRQALAFLAVIALVAISMVFLAPFVLLALGGLGVVLIVVTWLKAAIRARKVLAPFGPVEGALALSSLLLVIGAAAVSGLMIVRLGLGEAVSLGGAMLPMTVSGPRPGPRSVWYSDAATQQRLKDGLTKAGIPFRTRMQDGKEYVSWEHEHDEAAQRVSEEARNTDLVNNPASNRRSVSWGSAETQKDFIAWLDKRGIKSAIVPRDGKQYVEWEEKAETREIMEAFFKDRSKDCAGAKAKAKAKC